MTSLTDAREFLVELISQLFHGDVLITQQAERIRRSKPKWNGSEQRWVTRLGRPHERPRAQKDCRTAGPFVGRESALALMKQRADVRLSWPRVAPGAGTLHLGSEP